ncbi:hypothetical protein DFAR_2860006 [Desulfarculales bacterium]
MPRCGSIRLWGHGFVPVYFDEAFTDFGVSAALTLPGGVIRLRPWGCWNRFQLPMETIRQHLYNKLARGR